MAIQLSESVADEYIHTWKTARLSKDSAIGWSKASLIWRMMRYPYGASIGRYVGRILFEGETEIELAAIAVQAIVNDMLPGVRGPFEAYHVGVIRGDSCRHMPQKARALALGLPRQTYYDRIDFGRRIVQARIGEFIDCPYMKA